MFYLANNAFSPKTAPFLVRPMLDLQVLSDKATDVENMEGGGESGGAGEGGSHGILVVKMQGDLTFVHSFKIKEFLSNLITQEPVQPGTTASRSEALRYTVSSTLGAYCSLLSLPSSFLSPSPRTHAHTLTPLYPPSPSHYRQSITPSFNCHRPTCPPPCHRNRHVVCTFDGCDGTYCIE